MLNESLLANVNGTDLFPRLCERAAKGGYSLFLLGGLPGIAELTAQAMQERYPDLVIAGVHDGYFTSEQENQVIETINNSGASILLVGFGVPKQELWLANHLGQLQTTVNLGIGGLFDYYSGRIPRAPVWVREIGFEWVWRLVQERRMGLPLSPMVVHGAALGSVTDDTPLVPCTDCPAPNAETVPRMSAGMSINLTPAQWLPPRLIRSVFSWPNPAAPQLFAFYIAAFFPLFDHARFDSARPGRKRTRPLRLFGAFRNYPRWHNQPTYCGRTKNSCWCVMQNAEYPKGRSNRSLTFAAPQNQATRTEPRT